MKKRLAVLLATAMVLSMALTGCGSGGKEKTDAGKGETQGTSEEAKAENQETEAPKESEESELKVAFITPQSTGDNGPVDDIIKSLDYEHAAEKAANVLAHNMELRGKLPKEIKEIKSKYK